MKGEPPTTEQIRMSDTLSALHAAILETPLDRNVRLVYADALDETGEAANAVYAEFIRAHVALESTADDPERAQLASRCEELFADHWIEWWQPLCAALGLPEPFVPKQTRTARLRRAVRRETRERGEPYSAYNRGFSIRSDDHNFTVQFYAGFPEMLSIHVLHNHNLLAANRDWFAVAPFCRLRFHQQLEASVCDTLSGLNCSRVSELILDRVSGDFAERLQTVETFRNVTALTATVMEPTGVVRWLVQSPPWKQLRSLTLRGTAAPATLVELASFTRLEQLEELTFAIREVAELPSFSGLIGMIGGAIAGLISQLVNADPLPPGPIRGPDYWLSFFALGRSPFLSQLRSLRIVDADPSWLERAANTLLARNEPVGDSAPFISDDSMFALANGLNADKLERLELPRTRISAACRDELTRRFGSRVVLV